MRQVEDENASLKIVNDELRTTVSVGLRFLSYLDLTWQGDTDHWRKQHQQQRSYSFSKSCIRLTFPQALQDLEIHILCEICTEKLWHPYTYAPPSFAKFFV